MKRIVILVLAFVLILPTANANYGDTEKLRAGFVRILEKLFDSEHNCGVDVVRLRQIYTELKASTNEKPHSLLLKFQQYDLDIWDLMHGLNRYDLKVQLGYDLTSIKDCALPDVVLKYNPASLEFNRILTAVSREHFLNDHQPKIDAILINITARKGEDLYRTNREEIVRSTPKGLRYYMVYINLGDDQLGITAEELAKKIL